MGGKVVGMILDGKWVLMGNWGVWVGGVVWEGLGLVGGRGIGERGGKKLVGE